MSPKVARTSPSLSISRPTNTVKFDPGVSSSSTEHHARRLKKRSSRKSSLCTNKRSRAKHSVLPAFLSKTYQIFCHEEFADICGWDAAGDVIIVMHMENFIAKVLPKYFKHRNLPSFVRQLNLYGFHKAVSDSKRLEFQHPLFKRDRPELLHYIKRKVNNSASSQSDSTDQQSCSEQFSDSFESIVREVSILKEKNDMMEKRLSELTEESSAVRNDNNKLWKNLDSAKEKQSRMQGKLRKILYLLCEIYVGGRDSTAKLESAIFSDEFLENISIYGFKDIQELLGYLATEDTPLLTHATESKACIHKRLFVEVSNEIDNCFDDTSPLMTPLCNDLGSTLIDDHGGISPKASRSRNTSFMDWTAHKKRSDEDYATSDGLIHGEDLDALSRDITTSYLSSPNNSFSSTASSSTESMDVIGETLPCIPQIDATSVSNMGEENVAAFEDLETSLIDDCVDASINTLIKDLEYAHYRKDILDNGSKS